MKQLEIFHEENKITDKKNIYKLFVDGAARNNPGPAGAGIYLEHNKKSVLSKSAYLNEKTNNQAEYLALIFGLFYSLKNIEKNDLLEIISDSELLVRQISGIYKIKNPELQKLHKLTTSILKKINFTISHILREQNIIADKNANSAIDKKIHPSKEFIEFLQQNDISI